MHLMGCQPMSSCCDARQRNCFDHQTKHKQEDKSLKVPHLLVWEASHKVEVLQIQQLLLLLLRLLLRWTLLLLLAVVLLLLAVVLLPPCCVLLQGHGGARPTAVMVPEAARNN
jgi:hypothetical protein